jgi:hypothetical protein
MNKSNLTAHTYKYAILPLKHQRQKIVCSILTPCRWPLDHEDNDKNTTDSQNRTAPM